MEALKSRETTRPLFNLLRWTFGSLLIVFGLDKFTNLLTNWEGYLSPLLVNMLPFIPHVFVQVVGIVEIIAGVVVLTKPSIGKYIVGAWLTIIVITLIVDIT